MAYEDRCKFEDLKGKVLTKVHNEETRIVFETLDGSRFSMHHDQDCCERVYVESIVGDLEDLIGLPLLLAEESTNRNIENFKEGTGPSESFTWTFYKLATRKGYVDIRWLGESNGYYSESVSFERMNK